MRVAKTIELDESTERELRTLSKGRRVEARLQQRALVVLLAAEGLQNKEIAIKANLDRRQVALWRQRFRQGGVDALRKDAPRSGRHVTVTADMESRVVHATLHENPVDATHWTTRTLAAHLDMSATTIRRVWHSNGLKPHVSRGFKLSRDPQFEDKQLDVVGLYMNPPETALTGTTSPCRMRATAKPSKCTTRRSLPSRPRRRATAVDRQRTMSSPGQFRRQRSQAVP